MVAVVVEQVPEVGDPVTAELRVLLERLGELAVCEKSVNAAERIDRVSLLERIRSGVAAAQASELVRFARGQLTEQLASDAKPGLDPRKGIVDQLALACRISPHEAGSRLTAARAWAIELPQTGTALREGRISERTARAVVAATGHLDPSGQAAVDTWLAKAGIDRLGSVAAEKLALRHAYQHDPHRFVARGRHERQHRRVSLRPAPDTMAVLSTYLPVEQGVACLAALNQHADSLTATGDPRNRAQQLADTLVERLTGQATASDVSVEVQITLPLAALTDPGSPATGKLTGGLPVPGGILRDLLGSTRGRTWWRRIFTAPDQHGQPTVVGMDRRRRLFDPQLRATILARDEVCRMPYCSAPIRHIDHITPWASGGPTILGNGQGLCERHNHTKQLPGWHTTRTGNLITVHTPTGHHYESRPPDPP